MLAIDDEDQFEQPFLLINGLMDFHHSGPLKPKKVKHLLLKKTAYQLEKQ